MKRSRKEFIIDFLRATEALYLSFPGVFAPKSWHYRDLRIKGFGSDKIYRNVNNLRFRGILQKDKRGYFSFTKQGTRWAQKSSQRYLKLKNRTWDKKWRIVIFDIPQELHIARVKLRARLKNLGFYMLQKSVFIFPYPCEGELGTLCKELGVSDYVDVITAENAGFKEREIRKYYELEL